MKSFSPGQRPHDAAILTSTSRAEQKQNWDSFPPWVSSLLIQPVFWIIQYSFSAAMEKMNLVSIICLELVPEAI